ncbi:hypothetical protein MNBD_BACTEROID02-795 [hydrothermal vent metagenome]|uniref:Uncharacterized protein n=1 Tax=hydrothermal vent metagenome TaxID=652676 RepID=A0A3B0R7S0_9ZZZZ
MITDDKNQTNEKKVRPIIGLILLILSILLIIITGPIGILYGMFYSFYKKFISGIGTYFLEMAISIDQLGNVVMQHLLNLILLRKNAYKFGNPDETISSVIGKNLEKCTLTPFGKIISKTLDAIDPNHSLNSIDYYIEPKSNL